MRSTLEELNIAYHNSPLSEDHSGNIGPKPGERALDGDLVQGPDYETVALSKLCRTAAWVLLLFEGTSHQDRAESFKPLAANSGSRWFSHVHFYHVRATATAPLDFGPDSLLDPYGLLHDVYGVTEPAIYLIRPDACIGFRGRAADADRLSAYLERIFK